MQNIQDSKSFIHNISLSSFPFYGSLGIICTGQHNQLRNNEHLA